MVMPISSPAESQTLLSHWLTIAMSSTSVSRSVQTNNYTTLQTGKALSPVSVETITSQRVTMTSDLAFRWAFC